MVFTYVSKTEEQTSIIAGRLGTLLEQNDVITLEGDLGAGKTTFTKGLAKGLEIKKVVNSPTFSIIKEYKGRLPLYHMDVYRLHNSDEDLGFEEYFEGNGVSVVEWAHYIKEYLPEEYLTITIRLIDDGNREITFEPHGSRYESLCKELFVDENISN
ncbi:tRNA (adenosine(37)-N6)-threonylcarbamoyltransferase complex ATPase subunit type 1 TsaE [Lottiidibacillus patelloidae]|uniref:tRNA threonylcarbamoyladenosine biosynthesis protein TsaE n=1 Tax=Lottiidibacillus patelloidae TaxID=2670334 RepID=A0A263BPZ9_9BACI|nr:tRNA (adenosine(37)-N6)-threonylcarbamoyltransferase complex ATPase subunit type 1 TsaE [Lottiidibacillus patelloidae]OZM55814.1 tRNA (adenosine(37)-N6)-threonylcarbamoyltransferase complex ATPase subunit type 1 TsaE [Lottiidibacillus patelloidae]